MNFLNALLNENKWDNKYCKILTQQIKIKRAKHM